MIKGFQKMLMRDEVHINIEFMTHLSKLAEKERSVEETLVKSTVPADLFVWHESTYVHVK